MSLQIVTVVTAPAVASSPVGAYDLTDLATAKDEFEIPTADTSKDAFLQRAITQASAAIANYCNRVFQVEGLSDLIYVERLDPYRYREIGRLTQLQLSRWPIIAVASVVQSRGLGTTNTLVLGTDYRIDAGKGWLIRLNQFNGQPMPWEEWPVTVTYTAGFTKPIINEAVSVPAGPGPYTITVAKAASFTLDSGVIYAVSRLPLVAVASNPAAGQYSVSTAGVYTFAAADTGLGVLISYLYAAVPDDVIDACLRLITARLKSRGRDPYLRSQGESIGQQQYWVGPMIGQNGALPPEIQALVDNYRVPLVA